MKKVILGLIALVMCLSSFKGMAQESNPSIGYVENDIFIINANFEKVKVGWKKMLENQKIEIELSTFEIKKGIDADSKETYYYVIGKSNENDLKVAAALVLEDGKFYLELLSSEESPESKPGSGTVSCHGCHTGCDPEKIGRHWYCTSPCRYQKCEKTVTVLIHSFTED